MTGVELGKRKLTDKKKHISQLETYCYNTLDGLDLDKDAVSDFCFRALGAGIWALRYVARAKNMENIFVRVIKRIILEGGDADCNASVAGSLLGTWLGYTKLCQNGILSVIERMPNKKWLVDQITKYVNQKKMSSDSDSESEESPESEDNYGDSKDSESEESDTPEEPDIYD